MSSKQLSLEEDRKIRIQNLTKFLDEHKAALNKYQQKLDLALVAEAQLSAAQTHLAEAKQTHELELATAPDTPAGRHAVKQAAEAVVIEERNLDWAKKNLETQTTHWSGYFGWVSYSVDSTRRTIEYTEKNIQKLEDGLRKLQRY